MSWYRRYHVPGGTYFFTVVAYKRRPFLTGAMSRRCLRTAIERVRAKWAFEIVAFVLLPDHLHAVWTLPSGDARYSLRWWRIKEQFTREYLASGGTEVTPTASRLRQGERGIWQRRFWEHTCRDEDDLKRCVDYVHWNPRKHGLVKRVADWPWSSFHRFVHSGEYDMDWGGGQPVPDVPGAEWE